MFFQALKLLWISAAVYCQTHAQSLCALHILEDIEQEGISINIEKMSFNEIITSLLELIITAEKSDFSRVTGNFILGNANTCSQSAKGLTLEDARKLQREGITERINLSMKYVNNEVLTYDHVSTNALLLQGSEILALLQNYKIEEIEPAQNSDLYLQNDKIGVFTADTNYICQASTLLLQNGQDFNKLVHNI